MQVVMVDISQLEKEKENVNYKEADFPIQPIVLLRVYHCVHR